MAEHSISFTRSFEQHPCTIPKNQSMVVGNNLLISLKTDLFCLDATPTHRSAVVSAALFSFPVGRTDLSWGFFEKPGHQVEVQQGTVTVQTCSLHCVAIHRLAIHQTIWVGYLTHQTFIGVAMFMPGSMRGIIQNRKDFWCTKKRKH